MYCVFNATTSPFDSASSGNPLGWPFEDQYGYFCDQRDKGLFMLSNGLLNVLGLVGVYLVTVLIVGPRLMANRKPLEIKNLIRFYNATMILVNMYLIGRAMALVDYGRSFFNCNGVEMDLDRVDEIALMTELFLLSRLADFLDTIWFVLRKKQSHISFLHVFHHSYVPTVAYLATRWIPVVPNAMSFPFINSAIHVVMYAYYLLATYPSLRPHLWWKRYLTALQMLQFVAVLVYNIFGYYYFDKVCGKSQKAALTGSLISATIFLVLFQSFYRQAYSTPNKQSVPSNNCGKQHRDQKQLQSSRVADVERTA